LKKKFIQESFGRIKLKEYIKRICKAFQFKGHFSSVMPYGDGHINDTYKVIYLDELENEYVYILQRINHSIFKETEGLMENIQAVTSYLSDSPSEDYDVLSLVKTIDNQIYYKTDDGDYFRAYIFVRNSKSYSFTENLDLLTEAGKAFGSFQSLLKDFPVDSLNETIKDFHNTPVRYNYFIDVVKKNKKRLNDTCSDEIAFVNNRKAIISKITDGIKSERIPLRVTHNDTKLSNVLMDKDSNKGRCVIDLDTVMPGSALYDFGDAIRSCGSSVAEDEENLDKMDFDLDKFEAFTKGYLQVLQGELTPYEIDLLPMAAILMTLECGIRFLADYLEGDVYFKVHKPKHNLIRARNQFKFVEIMEESLDSMIAIVVKYCGWED